MKKSISSGVGASRIISGRSFAAAALRRFVADGHLGKLVRNLRLLGIDVRYNKNANDTQLLSTATTEDRALLTRDRRC